MPLRILFVEHDEDVRRTYLQYFERQGYETFGAINAEDTVNHAKLFQPDVIVIEPELLGRDQLLAINNSSNAPVVVVTRMRAISHVESALPVTTHFLKPVSMRELEAAIQSSLSTVHYAAH